MNPPVDAAQLPSETNTSTSNHEASQRRQIFIRPLGEDDWRLCPLHFEDIAPDSSELAVDPHPVVAQPDRHSEFVGARRLVAEQDGVTVGVVTVRSRPEDPSSADLGLWVAHAVRNSTTPTLLVEAAAALEAGGGTKDLYYWVGTDNASAIAFASNTGFRVTSHRRTVPTTSDQPGDQQVAFVMPLEADPGAVPNVFSTAPTDETPMNPTRDPRP